VLVKKNSPRQIDHAERRRRRRRRRRQ